MPSDNVTLPTTPRFFAEVTLPKGTAVRVGIANGHREWGRSGGVQFEVVEELVRTWFGPAQRIKR